MICSINKRRQNGREASILLNLIRKGKSSWDDNRLEDRKSTGNIYEILKREQFILKKLAILQVIG